jgi:hypothetical protein
VQQISTALLAEKCGAFDVAMGQNPEVDATPLSTLIAFDRSTTGDVFERLEGKGWIVRSPSPS